MTMPSIPHRGFTIPTLDITGEQDRLVIVDREDGQYLGHPDTVLLADGHTMLIVYPKGHGKGAIMLKRSEDGGRSWSERLPVPENWATSKETPTLYRMADGDGVERLILFSGLRPIRMAYSEDDGKSWSALEKIGDYHGIVAMASVLRLASGVYMAFFHQNDPKVPDSEAERGMTLCKAVSEDGGLTWSEAEAIAALPDAHLCEPGAIRSPDGKEMALLCRENSRQHNSFLVVSRDEGATWDEPVELPGALTGDRHMPMYAADGRLVICFRDTAHETETPGDWVAWVGTYDDVISGAEGQYRVHLKVNHHDWDCGYTGLVRLPDDTFVATTYGHWTAGEKPYVVSVRFNLAELDARVTTP